MRLSRRHWLKGLGGVSLGLPLFESLQPRTTHAQALEAEPFAIFLRQANGVAAAQTTGELGQEPERFWPNALGALDSANLSGRALDELSAFADRLLIPRGVNMEDFNYADGHARGALQALTAQGPTVEGVGGQSEAAGESLDHRLGRELNPDGRDSLFLYAGSTGGWLGGPCISYRGAANRRTALQDPWTAYQLIIGGDAGISDQAAALLASRQASVNDLVREQLDDLLTTTRLGSQDRQRLELHLSSVRDLEISLTCRLSEQAETTLQTASQPYTTSDGNQVLATARLHLQVAALAVACGYTRSVALQIGDGNDGSTRYYDPVSNQQMENFHYISHRRSSHDSTGGIIAGSDLLHHQIDRQFAQTFRHLLEQLEQYTTPSGTLLDAGVSVWFNDLGNGPAHARLNVPFILAGSAGGYLRQGQYLDLDAGNVPNHARLLNTLGTAAGLRNTSGEPIDDFGSATLERSVLSELLA